MQAILPCAGLGTRLGKLTKDIPKPLVEVNGKPLLDYALATLKHLNVKKVVLVTGYKKELIEEYAAQREDMDIVCKEQLELMSGLPNAILTGEKEINDDFIVLLPDFLFQENMYYAIKEHKRHKADTTIVLAEGKPLVNCGSFYMEKNIITAIKMNDGSQDEYYPYLAYGFDIHNQSFFDICKKLKKSQRNEYEIIDAYKRSLEEGRKLVGVVARKHCPHITTSEDIKDYERKVHDSV